MNRIPISHTVQALALVAGVLSSMPSHAAERVEKWPAWQQQRVALERRFVRDEFRIFYTLTGPDALPEGDQADSDRDGVPDKIQSIALQLVAARRCLVEVLGLRHPLQSPRYSGRVKFIEVNVWALEGKNGSAGDAIVNFHRPGDPPEGVEVVTIDLAAKLPTRNLSPPHELFHVFQNGYAQFKNAWYYEGMARWSESLLHAEAGTVGKLPVDAAALDGLFQQSYDASRFWLALARETDPAGTIRIPPDLAALRYIGSPKPIIEDDAFAGAALMKALLEEFDRGDDEASTAEGLDPLDWKEARQRAPENNARLWSAVLRAAQRFPADSPQLRLLLESLDRVTERPPGRPQVFRTFMPEAGPSAFAVVLTPELALCYDGLRGGVNQAWRGTVDLAPTFQAKINQPAAIRGAVFYAESTAQPLRINDPGKAPVRRFKGYRYAGDAVVFDFTLDGVAISETLRTVEGGRAVERSWRVEAGNSAVFFLAEAQSGADVACTGGREVSPGVWKFTSDRGAAFSFTMTLKPREAK